MLWNSDADIERLRARAARLGVERWQSPLPQPQASPIGAESEFAKSTQERKHLPIPRVGMPVPDDIVDFHARHELALATFFATVDSHLPVDPTALAPRWRSICGIPLGSARLLATERVLLAPHDTIAADIRRCLRLRPSKEWIPPIQPIFRRLSDIPQGERTALAGDLDCLQLPVLERLRETYAILAQERCRDVGSDPGSILKVTDWRRRRTRCEVGHITLDLFDITMQATTECELMAAVGANGKYNNYASGIINVIQGQIGLRLLIAELRSSPWPVDPFNPNHSPLKPQLQNGSIVGAYSYGIDGNDDGGDPSADLIIDLPPRPHAAP